MDVGATQIVNVIVGSSTSYLSIYSPVFLLMGGIVLGFGIMAMLIRVFFGRKVEIFDEEDYHYERD